MDFLHRRFRQFTLRRRENPSPTPSPSPSPSPSSLEHPKPKPKKQLLDLPPELIILIAEFLPPAPAACFALCTLNVRCLLGPRAWPAVKRLGSKARLEFLSLLAADLPEHFYCHECAKLHECIVVQWPRPTCINPKLCCIRSRHGYSPLVTTDYRITFVHTQLVMKRHYYGSNHGFPLDAFLHTEVEHRTDQEVLKLLSVDTTIVDNELLMRSQLWILIPQDRRDELISNRVCNHVYSGACATDGSTSLARTVLDGPDAHRKYCTDLQQCRECYMDFTMDVFDFGPGGVALLVTRWLNLGSGIDPEDAKWRSHVRSLRDGETHHPHELGSIQARFEGHTSKPVITLTKKNIVNLFSKRTRQHIACADNGFIWKLSLDLPPYYRWYTSPVQ